MGDIPVKDWSKERLLRDRERRIRKHLKTCDVMRKVIADLREKY